MTTDSPQIEHKMLEHALIKTAYEYLEKQLIDSMKDDMKQIATDAVKTWAEVRLNKAHEIGYGSTNINVQFIENIIRTELKDNPIQIIVEKDS